MREIKVDQGSPEWLMLRAGLPTASRFEDIVTPLGALSKSTRKYKAFLLAERIMRKPIIEAVSTWMDRGTQFESEAVSYLEMLTGKETQRCGFVVNDAGTIGASPDRWCGTDEQVEIKVPKPENHCGYWIAQCSIEACEEEIQKLIDSKEKADKDYLQGLQKRLDDAQNTSLAMEYRVQTQGQLWITERTASTLLSYSPEGLPPCLVRLKRDKPFIDILAQSVSEFSRELEAESARLVASGVIQQD
jgi:hypothetical protein